MSLRNKLEDFSATTEGKDAVPESVSVSERGEGEFETSAVWIEERERPSLLAEVGEGDDSEVETDMLPSSYYNTITDEELVSELSDVFADIRSVVSVSDGWDVHPFSFSTISEPEDDLDFENPFTPDWADFGAMALVTNATESVTEEGHSLLELICSEVQELDGAVTVDNLNTVEVNFSDWSVCHLQSVHVYVETESPHLFYEEVESVDEYVTAVAGSESEEADLLAQGSYEVFLRLDDPSGDGSEIDSEIVETAESLMAGRAESAVESEVDWFYESQSIVFNTENGDAEETAFYLRVPFCSEL